MRSLLAATALLVVMGAAAPSQARDYPVCSRSPQTDFNPSCSFNTFQQCRATISGIGGDCFRNPAFAYGQQPRGRSVRNAGPQGGWDNGWNNSGWNNNGWNDGWNNGGWRSGGGEWGRW